MGEQAENVEIVLECYRRREAGDLEGFAALFHPECRLTVPDGWPEPGPFLGRDQVIEEFDRLNAELEGARFEVEVMSAEGEWVLAAVGWKGRGGGSGLEVDFSVTNAARVENGLVTETHFRWDRAEALEAAGLPG